MIRDVTEPTRNALWAEGRDLNRKVQSALSRGHAADLRGAAQRLVAVADALASMVPVVEAGETAPAKPLAPVRVLESSCTSKRRYRTPEAAGAAADSAHAKGSTAELRVYACVFCAGFHLTHRTLEEFAAAARFAVRALTLWRPWTVLIARGIKRIENRPWEPAGQLSPGEWFAVHAGKKFDDDCIPMAQRLGVGLDVFAQAAIRVQGAIVAVCRYDGYVTESKDPWFFGPYGWVLGETVAVEPLECKGAQGLWHVPAALLPELRARFSKARGVRRDEGGPT